MGVIVHIMTFLVMQGLGPHFPMQWVWVRSLVGELRSHIPCDRKTKREIRPQDVKSKVWNG